MQSIINAEWSQWYTSEIMWYGQNKENKTSLIYMTCACRHVMCINEWITALLTHTSWSVFMISRILFLDMWYLESWILFWRTTVWDSKSSFSQNSLIRCWNFSDITVSGSDNEASTFGGMRQMKNWLNFGYCSKDHILQNPNR